ncbi:hypothetical protein ANRL4_01550 [Anaerolineae bacterium]|nr:hypothetical protein ANRL4_01550 [Anaerolineae bacterium]
MNTYSAFSIDVLIVTALSEELTALHDHFDFQSPTFVAGTSIPYFINDRVPCDSGTHNYCIAAFCLNAMGNTNAGIDVSNALRDLNPAYVFMFGLAGGIKGETDLTDVIVPNKIFYLTLGKISSDGQDTRPEPLRLDASLEARLRTYYLQIQATKAYQVRFGPLAVTDQVVANSEKVREILQVHPKMLGIEMESYGAGLAAFKAGSAVFAAVRGVSDHADEHKNDDRRPDALENAADFLMGFIQSGLLPKRPIPSKSIPKFIAIHHLSLYRRPAIRQAIQGYLERLQPFDLIEVLIDQTDLFQAGSLIDPVKALRGQVERLTAIETILREHPECELGYFGLAHIPLMFHMGYAINRREVRVFGTDYTSGVWLDLPEKSSLPVVRVEGLPEHLIDSPGDVVLLMSVSYNIHSAEPSQVVDRPTALVHIRAEQPRLGLIDSEEVLDRFTNTFRQVLQTLTATMPQISRIHLFYAGPPALAFRCGQQINRNIDPEIVVYNYSRRDRPHYRWAVNLQTNEIVERGEKHV